MKRKGRSRLFGRDENERRRVNFRVDVDIGSFKGSTLRPRVKGESGAQGGLTERYERRGPSDEDRSGGLEDGPSDVRRRRPIEIERQSAYDKIDAKILSP